MLGFRNSYPANGPVMMADFTCKINAIQKNALLNT